MQSQLTVFIVSVSAGGRLGGSRSSLAHSQVFAVGQIHTANPDFRYADEGACVNLHMDIVRNLGGVVNLQFAAKFGGTAGVQGGSDDGVIGIQCVLACVFGLHDQIAAINHQLIAVDAIVCSGNLNGAALNSDIAILAEAVNTTACTRINLELAAFYDQIRRVIHVDRRLRAIDNDFTATNGSRIFFSQNPVSVLRCDVEAAAFNGQCAIIVCGISRIDSGFFAVNGKITVFDDEKLAVSLNAITIIRIIRSDIKGTVFNGDIIIAQKTLLFAHNSEITVLDGHVVIAVDTVVGCCSNVKAAVFNGHSTVVAQHTDAIGFQNKSSGLD